MADAPTPVSFIEPQHILQAAELASKAENAPLDSRPLEERLQEMLQCLICHNLVHDAISPECGHLFCSYCLIRSCCGGRDPITIAHNLQGFSLSCPACSTSRVQARWDPAINRLVQALYPQQAAERAQQALDEKMREYLLPEIRKRIQRQLEAEIRPQLQQAVDGAVAFHHPHPVPVALPIPIAIHNDPNHWCWRFARRICPRMMVSRDSPPEYVLAYAIWLALDMPLAAVFRLTCLVVGLLIIVKGSLSFLH